VWDLSTIGGVADVFVSEIEGVSGRLDTELALRLEIIEMRRNQDVERVVESFPSVLGSPALGCSRCRLMELPLEMVDELVLLDVCSTSNRVLLRKRDLDVERCN
jgi:hypothetical protein